MIVFLATFLFSTGTYLYGYHVKCDGNQEISEVLIDTACWSTKSFSDTKSR